MICLNLVCEDEISGFVLSKIAKSFGGKYVIGKTYNRHGFGKIKSCIESFNKAAQFVPHLVLTDLDKYPCPLALILDWFNKTKKNRNLIFRIAVRQVEAWLLSDRQGFSNYTGVHIKHIPISPELETDSRKKLIEIVKKTKRKEIKEDIIPIDNNACIGPNYNGQLMNYVSHYWDLQRACHNSSSLKKALNYLKGFSTNKIQ